MKKIAIISVLLLCCGAFAFAADTNAKDMGVGKTQTINFITDVKVADKVLPAGEYRVQHVMEGDNHIMVFRSLANNSEQARVKCNMVELKTKAGQTSSEILKNPNGDRVVTAITFAGTRYKHQFVQ